MPTVGLIGAGFIGKLLLKKLLEANYPVTVFDVDESQVTEATSLGASAADSPAAVGHEAEIIIIAVPGTPEVEATMDGADGLLAGAGDGDIVIGVTTTLPETSVVAEERCEDRGITFVEAPITGGSPRQGYHMMIGATDSNYAAASEILDVICTDHTRIGETGDAMTFKLALQMRYAGHQAIDAEIVAFCRDNQIDPRPLNDFLEMGVWEQYFTEDFSQDIEGIGGLAIWHKDIAYARQVARENGTALPVNAVVHEAYKAIAPEASENEGHPARLLKYWQLLNGTLELNG